MNRNIPLSKKNQREMSSFIGNGLLFDYIQGQLDPERKQAVENYLQFSRDAQLELEKINNAIQYAQRLQKVSVHNEMINKIEAQQNSVQVFLQKTKLKQLPAGIRWGIEAIGAMILILLLLIFTPWQQLIQKTIQKQQDSIVLAELNLQNNANVDELHESSGNFGDEELGKSTNKLETNQEASPKSEQQTQIISKDENRQKLIDSKLDQAAKTASKNNQAKEVSANLESNQKQEGHLFRGELKITNVNATGAKITAKITELGGRKAGEVNLGWKKNPTSLYYHFTIPETKYKDLLAFLNGYGKINLVKEKHPRIMPEGIVRVILTVDEAQK